MGLSCSTRASFISPENRLALGHPFLSGLEECFVPLEYIHQYAAEFGGDLGPRFIAGGSADGNLSAYMALRYVSDLRSKLSGLMISCMTFYDPRASSAEYRKRYHPFQYANTRVIDTNAIELA